MNVLFISLGCDKNLVDSEYMLGILRERGYEFTDDETEADIIIVNSCCFIGDAKEESINTILEMGAYRLDETSRCRALIVTGCLAQRYADEIRDEIPEVDAVIGTTAYDAIGSVVERVLRGEYVRELQNTDRLVLSDLPRISTTGGYYSYLKIAEGCNKRCTYCIIPQLRGRYRSVPMERLIEEAAVLAGRGVRELILVAQETTVYGIDIYGKKMLPELLRRLCGIDGLEWIRIMYCYPEEITDELIDVIREEPKICHYIDMPIQHASDEILRRMGRKTNRAELKTKIDRIRERIPDVALRTTLITGFPGETRADQDILLDLVETVGFERLGVFTYSAEEGTVAADMENQIPEELKEERRDEVMSLQQGIAYDKAKEMTGRKLDAIIEGRLVDEDVYAARTYMDAPGVDGMLFISSERELMSGDIVHVMVTGAREYDLIGELCDEPAE